MFLSSPSKSAPANTRARTIAKIQARLFLRNVCTKIGRLLRIAALHLPWQWERWELRLFFFLQNQMQEGHMLHPWLALPRIRGIHLTLVYSQVRPASFFISALRRLSVTCAKFEPSQARLQGPGPLPGQKPPNPGKVRRNFLKSALVYGS